MTLQGGCSVWARMAKQWLFPSRICVQASLESLMTNHPSFPVLTSMCSGPQVCSAPAHCRTRSPTCLQATLRSLPCKPPPCLGLAVHLRGNLLLSPTRLSGGETESNSNRVLFSRGERVFTLLPCKAQVAQKCPSSVQHTEILKSPQNSSPFLFVCLFVFNTTFSVLLRNSFTALALSASECITASH